jgi:hypothetical protein
MLNLTTNCSKEVWESESLPRSAREVDTPERPPSPGGLYP